MTVRSIKDLPPHIQKQVMDKLSAEKSGNRKLSDVPKEKEKISKYRSQKTEINGIVFDSKKEAKRYEELLLLLKSGEIKDLRLQVEFTLQEAYTTYTGQRVRAIRYKADFSYIDKDGQRVVEDVKSKVTKTQVYAVKKKLLIEKYGVRIVEIE